MISAKLTSPGLLEINIFQDNGYDVISEHEVATKFYHVTQIIL